MNEIYYLPERRDDELRLAPVPDGDAALVAAYLDPAPLTGPARGRAEHVELDVVMRHSEDHVLEDDDYDARVELLDDDLRLVAGEWRTFDVEVTNLGRTTWPGGMDPRPQIRLAYRWVGAAGDLEDGMRTAIGAPLAPGASAIVPLEVRGPAKPGPCEIEIEIEIDLVHEHVRWFERGVRAQIEVRAPAGPREGSLDAP